ncbi:uncharacterized protein SCHCODRAFT_01177209 [Schizophyllum commune H4-8]|nr:uncharacterized protein SCHCODRAFT_01177209 [Schizophyllum commune H4-8]KAI5892336.1 hypothetical protein SCHCODRAFT_01177209 [Schizophyllum commune H4-8]
MGNPGAVALTASTGIAAANIGGQTIHSWVGFSEAKLGKPDVAGEVRRSAPQAVERWTSAKVLIIDESA